METKKGTKISDADAKKMDRSKMGIAIAGEADVEGQEMYIGIVECPWCGLRGRAILDTDRYSFFGCGHCGHHFHA